MAEQTILVFCRNYLVEDFRLNLAPLQGEYRFFFASDGPGDVDADTRADFYSYMKTPGSPSPLSPAVIENIRLRCRLLRHLPVPAAMARINAISFAMNRLLAQVNPAAVLCHMVDDRHAVTVMPPAWDPVHRVLRLVFSGPRAGDAIVLRAGL
jgi:hypothetical protein